MPSTKHSQPSILRIAIATPLRRLFDYLPPLEGITEYAIGARIVVPFRTSKKIGILVEITNHSEYPIDKLKRAYEVLDPYPLFPSTLLALIFWASRYYHEPLGTVFETALPSRLRKITSVAPRKSRGTTIPLPSTTFTESAVLTPNPEQTQAIHTITQQLGRI